MRPNDSRSRRSLIFVVFALVAGFPEAGEAFGTAFTQDPLYSVVVYDDPQTVQTVVNRELENADKMVVGGAGGSLDLYVLFPAAVLSLDPADWSAQSSNTSVVTVEFSLGGGAWLVFRPVGAGEATITAGYTGHGNSVRYSFKVWVRSAGEGTVEEEETTQDPLYSVVVHDDPQSVVNRELAYDMVVGGAGGSLDLFVLFPAAVLSFDPADWSAQSSDTSVVTVEFSLASGGDGRSGGGWLVFRPVGAGEATITAGYTGHGNSVRYSFMVFVVRAAGTTSDGGPGPVTNVQAVVNAEVDQAGGLEPGGDAVTIDVNDLFVNVGGATGRDFSARSSDGRVVTVEITDNPHVVIRPVGDGVADVLVRYTAGGSSAAASFGVAVGEGFRPPVPALPLAAAGLLAALLFGAGLRRRRVP